MTEKKTEAKKKAAGKFFAVDKNQWAVVCSLGIQAAAAYLVMACGTGKDHKSTKWSVRAVNKYTGLPYEPAKNAIESLFLFTVDTRFVVQTKGGARPEYEMKLSAEPKLIWLPNTIITGVRRGKPSPVKQLLMTSNVQALQLFVDLYSFQDLENESGVSASVLYKEYKGEKDFDYAEYSVWNFTKSETPTGVGKLSAPYIQKKSWTPFWKALQIIEDLQLIEWVPQLFSGEDGVHMHAYGTGRLDTKDPIELMENKIGRAAYFAAAAMRSALEIRSAKAQQTKENVFRAVEEVQEKYKNRPEALPSAYPQVPILKHIKAPAMRAVARLKFRPHTKPTRAWFSKLMESGEHQAAVYEQLRNRVLQESGLDRSGGESVKNSVADSLDLTGT